MKYSTRPTPRKDQARPSGLAIVIFSVLMVFAIIFSVWWGLSRMPAETEPSAERKVTVTHDSLAPTYTYDGEIIRWYVFIDPESSVQYLVNDRGGCTPRLDQYGNIVGVQYWNED